MKRNPLAPIKNSRGAVILSTLIVISLMVVIMIGVASIEVLQIAKDSARVNEAYRYLNVMEEMSQIVGRARILGKESQTAGASIGCPTGTVRIPSAGTPYVCLPDPDSDGDATVAGIREVCVVHTDYIGATETFCLNNLSFVAASGADEVMSVPAQPAVAPISAGREDLSSGTSWASSYHSNENWFPLPAWTESNEIMTPTCTNAADMWRGCMRCGQGGISCIQFEVCGGTGATCTTPYVQRIAVY